MKTTPSTLPPTFDPARVSGNPIIALESNQSSAGCGSSGCGEEIPVRAPDATHDSTFMAIMLTRKCNMTCAHCSVESGPRVSGEPSEEEILARVDAAIAGGACGMLITGGEPMLREKLALKVARRLQENGRAATMTSNGFWGKDPQRAEATVRQLCEAGITSLTISYDRYHAAFQGPEPAVNIAHAAAKTGLLLNISITRTAQDADLDAIVAPFAATPNARLRFYDVQPIGRARDLETDPLRAQNSGFCNACSAPALTDDGRLTACNGPSYFSQTGTPLVMGDLKDEPIENLLQRHREDPILDAIRTHGPQYLMNELAQIPQWREWASQPASGMCETCLRINSNPDAVRDLRAILSEPARVAERAARSIVICEARRGRDLSLNYVNTVGAARLLLQIARDPHGNWGDDAERVLGRADLDWNRQNHFVALNGFALPLARAISRPELQNWAPRFFVEAVQKGAIADGLRALIAQDAQRRIAAALREENAEGILLKGGALMALHAEVEEKNGASNTLPPRAFCDLDVCIAPGAAARVRERLLQNGFKGDALAACDEQSSLHQLPGLSFQGLNLEIHQSVMPAQFAIPEDEIKATARSLRDPELRGLKVLSPEAMLFHASVHTAKHHYAQGLKFAWDAMCLLENTPHFNWDEVANLAERTGLGRAFWTPLVVVARQTNLPVPTEFLARAPRDQRQQKLERFAAHYLFSTREFAYTTNPWITHPLWMAHSDSWNRRFRYVKNLLFTSEARGAQHKKLSSNPELRRSRGSKLREAVGVYRRALR